MATFMISFSILLRSSSESSQYQAFRKNGVWPFGGCNPAAAFSALSLCNLPPGPGFPTKIIIAIPRRKFAEQYSDDLPGMGCIPQREAPKSLPQERRLAVRRLQPRRGIFGLVALHSSSWSRFHHPQEERRRDDSDDFLDTGCTPQREATRTFDTYFPSSPDRGLLLPAASRHPCLSDRG